MNFAGPTLETLAMVDGVGVDGVVGGWSGGGWCGGWMEW